MPDTDIAITDSSRAEQVRLQILQVGNGLHRGFVALGHLLKEARDNAYHLTWGYRRFGDWVESTELDLSERSAYDLIRIVETAERLQIADSELEGIKVSNLKQICSLPDSTPEETIRELIDNAKTMAYKDVREVVGKIKNDAFVYHTIKMSEDAENNVYQPSLERVRREYGNTVGPDGQPEDISDSRAIEMLMADFLSTPEAEEIQEGEFVDIIEG